MQSPQRGHAAPRGSTPNNIPCHIYLPHSLSLFLCVWMCLPPHTHACMCVCVCARGSVRVNSEDSFNTTPLRVLQQVMCGLRTCCASLTSPVSLRRARSCRKDASDGRGLGSGSHVSCRSSARVQYLHHAHPQDRGGVQHTFNPGGSSKAL
jgi:hypothetical protein